jgi:hypothetical protein
MLGERMLRAARCMAWEQLVVGRNEGMCDVHLAETLRVNCPVNDGTRCSYCGAAIVGEGGCVERHLNDATPGLHRLVSHEDCAWDMEHALHEIDANHGCISYGSAVEVIEVE